MKDRDRLERKQRQMEKAIQKAIVDFEKFSGLRVTSIRTDANSRRTLSTATLREQPDEIPVLTDEATP